MLVTSEVFSALNEAKKRRCPSWLEQRAPIAGSDSGLTEAGVAPARRQGTATNGLAEAAERANFAEPSQQGSHTEVRFEALTAR